MINLKGGDSLKKEKYSLKSSLQVGVQTQDVKKFPPDAFSACCVCWVSSLLNFYEPVLLFCEHCTQAIDQNLTSSQPQVTQSSPNPAYKSDNIYLPFHLYGKPSWLLEENKD